MSPFQVPNRLFQSFWVGGFEAACHINREGTRVDLTASTGHESRIDQDYGMLPPLGIRTVRDGVRWPLIERAGRFDFSSFLPMLRAARRQGVQVIWTLCHYGWPEDIDVFSPAFPERFARYCRAVAQVVREETDEIPYYTPVNEPSFLAWGTGDAQLIWPFAKGRDHELKRQFVAAAIAGGDALKEVDPRAALAYVDPVINVLPRRDRPHEAEMTRAYTNSQFECWDMLLGRLHPELGGHAGAVTAMGLNFYHSNQWVHDEGRLRWEDEPRDPRWVPLHQLVKRVYDRYHLPVFIGETGHFGAGRARWIREIGDEVIAMHRVGIPLEGVCLYPVLDRHDWDDPRHWHNSGLIDVNFSDGSLDRSVNLEYEQAFREVQERVAESVGWGKEEEAA